MIFCFERNVKRHGSHTLCGVCTAAGKKIQKLIVFQAICFEFLKTDYLFAIFFLHQDWIKNNFMLIHPNRKNKHIFFMIILFAVDNNNAIQIAVWGDRRFL